MNAQDGYAGLKAALNTTLTESERERTQRDLERLNALQWERDVKEHRDVLAKLPKPQGMGDL